MSDWREELMATLRDTGCHPTGGLHPRETLDLLVAAQLLHRRFRFRHWCGFPSSGVNGGVSPLP